MSIKINEIKKDLDKLLEAMTAKQITESESLFAIRGIIGRLANESRSAKGRATWGNIARLFQAKYRSQIVCAAEV